MPKILSEEEKKESKNKRQEYLKKWRKEHGMEYYDRHKDEILKKQREKRMNEKGSELRTYNKRKINEFEKGYIQGIKVENEIVIRNLEETIFDLKTKRDNGEIVIAYHSIKKHLEEVIEKIRLK